MKIFFNKIKVMEMLLLAFLLQGCISLTSKYEPISYYKLEQEPVSARNLGKVNVTLMIRDFSVSSELETEHLMTTWDDNSIQKYYYHRWISDLNLMITDFFVSRYAKTEVFTGGVVKTSSWVVPDYVVEGNINEIMSYSTKTKSKNSDYVNLSIQITLIRRNPLKTDKEVVFSENYVQKVQRTDDLVGSIVPAMSKALSQTADKILLDLQSAIAFDQSKQKDSKQ